MIALINLQMIVSKPEQSRLERKIQVYTNPDRNIDAGTRIGVILQTMGEIERINYAKEQIFSTIAVRHALALEQSINNGEKILMN